LNGRIEKKGEPAYTERGFVYSSTFQNPSIDDDDSWKKIVSGTSMDFSANVSGLTAEVTYYVRAYATNNNGTVYGESVSFKPTTVKDYIVLQSEGIMVQTNDISSGADWTTANNLCKSSRVGGYSDWRLPTRGELNALYDNRTTIGGFSNTQYWSCDYHGSYYYYYYAKDFSTGNISYYGDGSSFRVRAVRTLP
jgi:hypothetical protein